MPGLEGTQGYSQTALRAGVPPRRCLLVGATGGIGRAVARSLCAAGHSVALAGRDLDALESLAGDLGEEAVAFVSELSGTGAVAGLVADCARRLGPPEVLVVASGTAASASVTATTDALWDEIIEVNLTLPHRLIREVLPAMVRARWGRIVVVGSTVALRGAPYVGAYAASKHGLLGYIRCVAQETAAKGVTANMVCPGYVNTPMTDRTVATIAQRTALGPDEARAFVERQQGNGRLVEPEEVADAVEYLVGASAVNGRALVLDGGDPR